MGDQLIKDAPSLHFNTGLSDLHDSHGGDDSADPQQHGRFEPPDLLL